MQQLKNELIELINNADIDELWKVRQLFNDQDFHKRYHKQGKVVYRMSELCETQTQPTKTETRTVHSHGTPDSDRDVQLNLSDGSVAKGYHIDANHYSGPKSHGWWKYTDIPGDSVLLNSIQPHATVDLWSELTTTCEMKISPSEQPKPDGCRDVMVTYKGEECDGWWYKSSDGDSLGPHWIIRSDHETTLFGSDIALVTSWREIE